MFGLHLTIDRRCNKTSGNLRYGGRRN